VRKIRFFQAEAYLSIDYAAQKVDVWRLVHGAGPVPLDAAQGRPSIEGGEIAVTNEEPLARELADFVDAVVSGRAPVGTLTVFVGVLGGIAAFGAIGLFLGPVVLAILFTFVGIYREEYQEPAVAMPPPDCMTKRRPRYPSSRSASSSRPR